MLLMIFKSSVMKGDGVHLIEVPVPSQESERSCIRVLGVSIYLI